MIKMIKYIDIIIPRGGKELVKKGYKLQFRPKTSGPINAIFFDNINKTFQGGSSDFGEDYGIAWNNNFWYYWLYLFFII